jgi:hypothetical protein
MMQTFGVICVLLGVLLSVIGIVTGFWLAITRGRGEEWFKFVPAGFVFLLLGVTVTQLHKK